MRALVLLSLVAATPAIAHPGHMDLAHAFSLPHLIPLAAIIGIGYLAYRAIKKRT